MNSIIKCQQLGIKEFRQNVKRLIRLTPSQIIIKLFLLNSVVLCDFTSYIMRLLCRAMDYAPNHNTIRPLIRSKQYVPA